VTGSPPTDPPDLDPSATEWALRRVRRDAIGVGLATGAYGLSYGAIAVASGLDVAQTVATSLLMFTGASQFALVGVVGAGGSPAAAAASAVLLGGRNALYALRLGPLLSLRGGSRLLGAQLVIDESTAMALAHEEDPTRRRAAFWWTGASVFVLWNLATLVGALAGTQLADPATLGLDAAVPAAFLALLWPRLRDTRTRTLAGVAALVAVALVPVTPAGVPVMAAALVAVAAGLRWGRAVAP
jgi:predicted branched-subunit amino acid permease